MFKLTYEIKASLIKVWHSPSKKKLFYLLQWKPFKMMQNAFYFISKSQSVPKIFEFLYWIFGHIEKTT